MLNRRDLLRWLGRGALGTSALAAGCGPRSHQNPHSPPQETPPTDTPDFTVGFLTDSHVFPEQGAPDGSRRAFEHAMALDRPPEVILTGGDLVFDLLAVGHESAKTQLDLFDQAIAPVTVPIHHTMGNHDLFGLYPDSGIAADDPLRGKQYFLDHFGLEKTYRSFDHEGWHFVILDTMEIVDDHYRGWVDEEQLAWLEDDLASSGKPTVVVGHIPLFSNYVEWNYGTSEGISERVTVVNSHEVAKVLMRHPVKLVLAGHLHVNETFQYKGIHFANVGAISGNWWRGLRDGFEEGYAILEFRGDEVDWNYVDYGWEAKTDEA